MKKETIIYLWPEVPGNRLTDGKDYYEAVKLGEGRSADEFWEITEEEYNTILATMTAEADEL